RAQILSLASESSRQPRRIASAPAALLVGAAAPTGNLWLRPQDALRAREGNPGSQHASGGRLRGHAEGSKQLASHPLREPAADTSDQRASAGRTRLLRPQGS